MTFRIHFEYPNGEEDSIDIRAETIEAIRMAAHQELAKRGGVNPWSEELDDDAS